jgi:type IV secretory pathway protease TraF
MSGSKRWIRENRGFIVFILMQGDNRDNSADSRYIGFIPREERFGKSLY